MTLFSILLAGCISSVAIGAYGQSGELPLARALPDASSTDAPSGADVKLESRHPRYRLRKGDSFNLDMSLSPEFNQEVSVQPDGYATLKGIGTLYVEGQTVPELTETLKNAYSTILHDPIIAISLKDFEKPYFIATGQVGRPGKYDLRSDITVTEAVAIAGGFNAKAKHSQVVLFRPLSSGGYQAKLLNIKELLAKRDLSEDVVMHPGDMLYVPQNTFSKISPFLPTSSMGVFASPWGF